MCEREVMVEDVADSWRTSNPCGTVWISEPGVALDSVASDDDFGEAYLALLIEYEESLRTSQS